MSINNVKSHRLQLQLEIALKSMLELSDLISKLHLTNLKGLIGFNSHIYKDTHIQTHFLGLFNQHPRSCAHSYSIGILV